jgi:putative DNA primase/helicase
MMLAADIHARIGSAWPTILTQLGIPESVLRNRHGPCPACGGKDRFRFDNRRGGGDYICNQCGAGDGFTLLQRVYGWPFSEARRQVMRAAGLVDQELIRVPARIPSTSTGCAERMSDPPERVLRLWRNRCAVADCDDAVTYLTSRRLWPLPVGCALSAHPTVEYFEARRRVGLFPALVAGISDIAGDLVSVHVTFLRDGKKLAGREPRKMLSRVRGRTGCAVRLMACNEELGVAEGVETALSASAITGIPVWAALSASLLASFEPPRGIASLRVFADNDEPGVAAAQRLVERLRGRVCTEVHMPPRPAKDWNDVSVARSADPPEAKQQGRLE